MILQLLIFLLSGPAFAGLLEISDSDRAKTRCYFKNTLVVGASVSAGFPFGMIRPVGQILTEMYNGKMTNLATSWTTGRYQLSKLDGMKGQNQLTMVFALDTFFWDTVYGFVRVDKSVATVDRFFDIAKGNNAVIAISQPPELIITDKLARGRIVERIRQRCAGYPYCILMNAKPFYRSLIDNGYVEHKGKRYMDRDVRLDPLHLKELGNQIIADFLLSKLLEQPWNCLKPPHQDWRQPTSKIPQ